MQAYSSSRRATPLDPPFVLWFLQHGASRGRKHVRRYNCLDDDVERRVSSGGRVKRRNTYGLVPSMERPLFSRTLNGQTMHDARSVMLRGEGIATAHKREGDTG